MGAEDAGSVYSEVRIRLDKLQSDITQAVSVMDRFGQKVVDTGNIASNLFSNSYGKSIRQVESYVKSLDKAVADGALTQKQAVMAAIEARKAEMAYIQATAAKKGGFTEQEISDLKRVKGQLTTLTAEQKKLGDETAKSAGGFKALALAASVAVIDTFRKMTVETLAYSSALAGVRAASRGTSEDLALLASAAETSGKALGASSTEALKAEEALLKAGITVSEIMAGALPGALTLAAAGTMDVADAAEIAAATMTQFKLGGKDVAMIADLLAAGAGKAQGEVSDLSQALKQSGLVASQTGLSIKDTVGSLAAFASAGLLGSDAGTSFRTMLLRLTPQSKEASDEMKRLGLNAFDAKGEFIGIEKFAGLLQSQLKNLTTEQRNSALATIFGSDSIRAANVLYTQGAKGIGEWIGKVNDTGFAAETARIKLDSLAGDVQKLNAQVSTTAAKIGDGLNPTLRGFTQFLTSAADAIGQLPSWLTSFAVASGVLAASLIGLNSGLGLLGINLVALLGPVGLVGAGMATLAIGIAAATNAVNQSNVEKAGKAFGDIGISAGRSGEELQKFAQSANDAEFFLRALSADGRTSAKSFEQLAKDLGLTNDELAQIALRSPKASSAIKAVASGYIDQFRAAKELSDAQRAFRAAEQEQNKTAVKDSKDSTGTITANQQRIIDALKKTNDAHDETTATFQAGNEKTNQGLETELDRLDEINKARLKEVDSLLAYKAINGSLTKDQQERLSSLIKWIKEDANGFNLLTQQAKDWSDAETESYQTWKKTVDDRIALQDFLLANANEDNIALIDMETLTIDQLTALNEKLAQAKQDKMDAFVANANEVNLALIDLDSLTVDQLIALNEKLAQAKADSNQKELDDNIKLADMILATFSGLVSALGDLFSNLYSRQIEEADRAYATEKERIENNGLTKKEVLEKNVADAQATGDATAISDAERALKLYNLEADFEKKKAKLQYDAAMASWGIQVAMATAQAAQAVLAAFTSSAQAGIAGLIGAPLAATLAGGFGALQIAAVVAAQPQPPQFATGGLVLPSGSAGKQVTVADQGGGELMFGTGALGQPLMQGFARMVADMVQSSGGGKDIAVVVNINGKTMAQAVAKEFNNGTVKVDL